MPIIHSEKPQTRTQVIRTEKGIITIGIPYGNIIEHIKPPQKKPSCIEKIKKLFPR